MLQLLAHYTLLLELMAFHSTTNLNPWDRASPTARIDSKETPTAYVFVADLPGLNKEQVKVEVVDNRVLQISGERKDDDDDGEVEKNNKWHCKERSSGPFLRRFRLPEDANVELVKAKLEYGVLTVTVPKLELQQLKTTKPKAIEISVSGEGEKKVLHGRKKKMLCCGLGGV